MRSNAGVGGEAIGCQRQNPANSTRSANGLLGSTPITLQPCHTMRRPSRCRQSFIYSPPCSSLTTSDFIADAGSQRVPSIKYSRAHHLQLMADLQRISEVCIQYGKLRVVHIQFHDHNGRHTPTGAHATCFPQHSTSDSSTRPQRSMPHRSAPSQYHRQITH